MDTIVAVVTDLFFQGRIAAAARAAGRPLRFIMSETQVSDVLGGTALVDLDASVDVLSVIEELKLNGVNIVAFGPHLDTEGRRAARAAGANRVLAKSKFVEVLPDLMGAPTVDSVVPVTLE